MRGGTRRQRRAICLASDPAACNRDHAVRIRLRADTTGIMGSFIPSRLVYIGENPADPNCHRSEPHKPFIRPDFYGAASSAPMPIEAAGSAISLASFSKCRNACDDVLVFDENDFIDVFLDYWIRVLTWNANSQAIGIVFFRATRCAAR